MIVSIRVSLCFAEGLREKCAYFICRQSLVPVSSLAECTVSGATDSAEIRNTCWTSGVYIDLDKWSNEPTDVRYSLKQFVSGC